MREWMLVVAIAAALGGCASNTRWVRAGATNADFERDRAVCEFEAAKATAGVTGVVGGLEMANVLQLCMRAKGWSLQSG